MGETIRGGGRESLRKCRQYTVDIINQTFYGHGLDVEYRNTYIAEPPLIS